LTGTSSTTKILFLGGNELQEVDLSPVADCPLEKVFLDGNAVVQKLTKDGEVITRRYEEMRRMVEEAEG